jgi:hypothetical protein
MRENKVFVALLQIDDDSLDSLIFRLTHHTLVQKSLRVSPQKFKKRIATSNLLLVPFLFQHNVQRVAYWLAQKEEPRRSKVVYINLV